jgi:hypothetical protein
MSGQPPTMQSMPCAWHSRTASSETLPVPKERWNHTRHIVLASVTVPLMLLAIGFGAAAFGKRFRLYSIASLVILVAFGALTFLDAPRIAANLPTPWIGVWERINLGVFLLWVVVLAAALLRARDTASMTGRRDAVAA